jgi:TonB family protein
VNADGTAWTPGRWATLGGLLVTGHLLIAWLALQPPAPPSLDPGAGGMVTRWTPSRPDPLSGWAARPARFALPRPDGFSADAAAGLPRVDYRISDPPAERTFLPANPDGTHLGGIPSVVRTPSPPRPTVPDVGGLGLPRPLAAAGGQVELRGSPQLGSLVREIVVPGWVEPGSPQPMRIEFAVNPPGEVVTARITLSSGSKNSDTLALAAVRAARFTPREIPTSTGLLRADQLVWGVATLHPAALPTPPPATPAPVTGTPSAR